MTFPRSLSLVQRLDDDPRYEGSIHDTAVAQARGFRAALVPGAFVYGHVSRMAVQAWGQTWIDRGAMGLRFRRPVFDGDTLRLEAGPLEPESDMPRAAVTVAGPDPDAVAEGWIGLPSELPRPPDPETLPRGTPGARQTVAAGEIVQGHAFSTVPRPLEIAEIARSAEAMGETEAIYDAGGLAHSACLMRIAMTDAYSAFRFPGAVILAEIEAQHFAPVRAGAMIETRGSIRRIWERRVKHFFEAEEWLLADGQVAARFRRSTIYA